MAKSRPLSPPLPPTASLSSAVPLPLASSPHPPPPVSPPPLPPSLHNDSTKAAGVHGKGTNAANSKPRLHSLFLPPTVSVSVASSPPSSLSPSPISPSPPPSLHSDVAKTPKEAEKRSNAAKLESRPLSLSLPRNMSVASVPSPSLSLSPSPTPPLPPPSLHSDIAKTLKNMKVFEKGTPGTSSWRANFFSAGQQFSPLNDVPLYETGDMASSQFVHCICLTPASTWIRHEVSQGDYMHPLRVSCSVVPAHMTAGSPQMVVSVSDNGEGERVRRGSWRRVSDTSANPVVQAKNAVLGHSLSKRWSSPGVIRQTHVIPSAARARLLPSTGVCSSLSASSEECCLSNEDEVERSPDKSPGVKCSSTNSFLEKVNKQRSTLQKVHKQQPVQNLLSDESGHDVSQDSSESQCSEMVSAPNRWADNAPWNIGYLSQTWANPALRPSHPSLHASPHSAEYTTGSVTDQWHYDSCPMEVIDIGAETRRTVGEVYLVKPLGSFLIGKEDGSKELSWKVIAITADDPMAGQLSSLKDLQRLLPGSLELIREWLRTCCLIRPGDRPHTVHLDHQPVDMQPALTAIADLHCAWRLRLQSSLKPRSTKFPSPSSAIQPRPVLVAWSSMPAPSCDRTSVRSFEFDLHSESSTPASFVSFSSSFEGLPAGHSPLSVDAIPSSNPNGDDLFLGFGSDLLRKGCKPLPPIKIPKCLPISSEEALTPPSSGNAHKLHSRNNSRTSLEAVTEHPMLPRASSAQIDRRVLSSKRMGIMKFLFRQQHHP
eukprot:TRINITY_DN179_c0_g1_i1.p1 TRINITY_DN179_c0_g1~~TRINITY_DN179_c0_g1_i1.p1  ORF type:complete len:769 (+),score=93.93 TRINITY_DN179_c0_g1_i1:848-3154(+)